MKRTQFRTRLAAGAVVVAMTSSFVGLNATEKQIADLEEDIAALKIELGEVSEAGDAATQLISNIETAKQEIEKSREALTGKEKELAAKSYLLGIYQSAFRVTTTMIAGEDLGTIQLNTGEVIPGASFLKIEKGGIQVQTGIGTKSIPISQLPAAMSVKLQLPPSITAPTTTLEVVKASKPALLRTKEDIAAAEAVRAAGASLGTAGVPPAEVAAGTAAQPSQADQYQQIQQRNAARQKQIQEIKARYAVLFSEKKKARSDKAADEAGFRSAKIKKAQTEIKAAMDFHNSRIARIEAEEASLRTEMARIQSEFE